MMANGINYIAIFISIIPNTSMISGMILSTYNDGYVDHGKTTSYIKGRGQRDSRGS